MRFWKKLDLDCGVLGTHKAEFEFEFTPGTAPIMYRSNGDPGDPGDPEEVDIRSVTLEKGLFVAKPFLYPLCDNEEVRAQLIAHAEEELGRMREESERERWES